VSIEEDEVGFLLKLALTPEGNPLTDNVTEPENPPAGTTLIVSLPREPREMTSEVGDAESVKLCAGAGVMVMDSLPLTLEPSCAVAVTSTVPAFPVVNRPDAFMVAEPVPFATDHVTVLSEAFAGNTVTAI
jgi:hypothetical protein